MEDWRVIDGYDGAYWVSDQGRVWSTRAKRVLAAGKHSGGYLQVRLLGQSKYIHRIVMTAFITQPEEASQVNHKNGVKTDNHIDNLEWCTPSENLKHTFSHLGRKNASTPVARYTLDGVFVDSFPSIRDAARDTETDFTHIRLCVIGRQSRAGKFMWRKKECGDRVPPYRLGKTAPRAVKKLAASGEKLCEYPSINGACVAEKIDISSLHKVLRGGAKTVGGYKWAYV